MELLERIYKRLLTKTDTKFYRFLYYNIDWSQPLIGIKGQRGVGKTTMMLQRIKTSDPTGEKSFYASLDNMWFANHSLLDLAEEMSTRGVLNLYLDEVHRIPDWERQLKNIYDSYPELHVVFTGSSLLIIDHSIGDLSRRVAMHHLPGLSFREFLILDGKVEAFSPISFTDILYNHEKIAPGLCADIDMVARFHDYMKKGYYPYFKTMTVSDFYGRLSNSVSSVIESDIPTVEKKIDYETLLKAKRLMAIIAGTLPYIPNLTSLADVMSTSRSQLIRLFDLLDRAGLIRQLFLSTKSPKSLAKPQKILLNNSSLMYALDAPQIGAARESTFASLLSANHKVGFAKDGDFIVDGRYLFEVGGKGKGFAQIRNIPDSFIVADDIEYGFGNKIPLWLFGLIY